MGTQIYYFSGTGNSLHIAKELQNRLSDTNLISMISAIKSNKMETKVDKVGFIFPINGSFFPLMCFLIKSVIYIHSYSTSCPSHSA